MMSVTNFILNLNLKSKPCLNWLSTLCWLVLLALLPVAAVLRTQDFACARVRIWHRRDHGDE